MGNINFVVDLKKWVGLELEFKTVKSSYYTTFKVYAYTTTKVISNAAKP